MELMSSIALITFIEENTGQMNFNQLRTVRVREDEFLIRDCHWEVCLPAATQGVRIVKRTFFSLFFFLNTIDSICIIKTTAKHRERDREKKQPIR